MWEEVEIMKKKRIAVWIGTYLLLMFLNCFPLSIGGNVYKHYNTFVEVSLIWIISNKVVEWIFDDKKESGEEKK